MTAPVSTSRKSRPADTSAVATRRGHRSARPGAGRGAGSATPEGRSAAAQRAYQRRERRTGSLRASGELVSRGRDSRTLARRIPFVVLVMAMLISGMGLTLWLSTNSTGQSYEVSAAKQRNQDLRNQTAALEQAVEAGNSAPDLALKAKDLGMVQSRDVARMIVAEDGTVRLEGIPVPADGPDPAPLTSARPAVAAPAPARPAAGPKPLPLPLPAPAPVPEPVPAPEGAEQSPPPADAPLPPELSPAIGDEVPAGTQPVGTEPLDPAGGR